MFISAVWSLNLSYLFTFGSILGSFIISVKFFRQNFPQLTFISYSLVILCGHLPRKGVTYLLTYLLYHLSFLHCGCVLRAAACTRAEVVVRTCILLCLLTLYEFSCDRLHGLVLV